MAQFQALAPGVEVEGSAVLAVVRGMGRFKILALEILADHGILEPRPGRWFPQQAWLDAFRDISVQLGPHTLVQIGKQIPATARWPSGISDVHAALASIDVAYRLNHRGGELGAYRYEATGPRSGQAVCSNPYPCPFDQGVLLGVVRRFCPPDAALLEVPHAPGSPCRMHGAEACTYLLAW